MLQQDHVYSLELIHELLECLEAEWDCQQLLDKIDYIWISAVIFLLVSLFGGMCHCGVV